MQPPSFCRRTSVLVSSRTLVTGDHHGSNKADSAIDTTKLVRFHDVLSWPRHLLLKFVLDLSSQKSTSDTKLAFNVRNEIAVAARWRVERLYPYMEPGWRVDTQGEKRQSALITGQVTTPSPAFTRTLEQARLAAGGTRDSALSGGRGW